MEIKTRRELLSDFMTADFVIKANIIDKLDTEKWVSVDSLKEFVKDEIGNRSIECILDELKKQGVK